MNIDNVTDVLNNLPVDTKQVLNELQAEYLNDFFKSVAGGNASPQNEGYNGKLAVDPNQSMPKWKIALIASIAYFVLSSPIFQSILSKLPLMGEENSIKNTAISTLIFAIVIIASLYLM